MNARGGRWIPSRFASVLVAGLLPMLFPQPATGAGQLFSETIQPLLKQHCLGCHGNGQTLGGLDLRHRESALTGGTRGPAIVPGDPDASLLLAAIEHRGDLQMPPGGPDKRLSTEAQEAFRGWIGAGAPYAEARHEGRWDFDEADLWAFRPVRDVHPPSVPVGAGDVRTPVDSFILDRLAEEGIEPSPRADPLTLIRRVTYDLTGLPPTPEEIDAFLEDHGDRAYKELVERLLDSPRYGEKWGRHWLDVTRYADTNGFSNDFERPNAWRYRDYVIRSFSRDKPYDRFILEQIAGDELFPDDPDAILATGFLRTGPWEHTGMAVAAVTRQQFLDDVTHHVGQSFLGLTLACARCHDHKFDPIPTADYYRMQAVFAGTAFARRPFAFLTSERTEDFEAGRAPLTARLEELERRMEAVHDTARTRLAKKKGRETAERAPSSVLQRYLSKDEGEMLKLLRKRSTMHKLSLLRFEPLAMTVTNGLVPQWDPVAARNSYLKAGDYTHARTHVLEGGDIQAPGEEVAPGTLEAIERYAGLPPPDVPESIEGRRSALARWVADPRNPLTARVMANRIWQYHFGRALAANPNNVGKMGGKPTHPGLLDWLAAFFVEHGWSVKAVHRVILLSEAYRRGSAHDDADHLNSVDPENRWLARFSPRRLTAEELRDSMLSVAGELSDLAGGPGTYPQINSAVARQPRHAMGSLRPTYEAEPSRHRRNRRSIYSFQARSLVDPMMEVFNAANPDLTCERRDSSTVATQAFVMLNSEQSREMAMAMAVRLAGLPENQRVAWAFRLALGRYPVREEVAWTRDFLGAMTEEHARNPVEPRPPAEPIAHQITSELTGEKFEVVQPAFAGPYEHNPHPSDEAPPVRALANLALVLFNSNEFAYVY